MLSRVHLSGLNVHLLGRELADLDLLVHPLVAGIEAARVAISAPIPVSSEGLGYIEWRAVFDDVVTGARQLVRHCLDDHDRQASDFFWYQRLIVAS